MLGHLISAAGVRTCGVRANAATRHVAAHRQPDRSRPHLILITSPSRPDQRRFTHVFPTLSDSAARIPPLWFGHGLRKPPDPDRVGLCADRPTEDIWSLRTMGIWSEPYENDLRVLTNGDELELGFDDSFGFSAAIGWQPKGFAFGFELEYRSTEHELASGKLPELGAITADATRTVETIFLNAVARQQLGWTSPSLAASAWAIRVLILIFGVWVDTPTLMLGSSRKTPSPSKDLLDLKKPSPMIWDLSPNLGGSNPTNLDSKMS